MSNHPLTQISFSISDSAWVVEASAGTGKTWTIERLFIKALLEATRYGVEEIPISLENILVVTFTNDATEELKQRIQEQMQSSVNLIIFWHNLGLDNIKFSELDPFQIYLFNRIKNNDFRKDITVLSRALQNFDLAAIFTIHSFCNKILHDFPFECNVNPEFELVSSKVDIYNRLVLNFLRSEIINNPFLKPYINEVYTNLEKLFASDNLELTLAERIAQKLPSDLFKIEQKELIVKYKFNSSPCLDKLIQKELDGEEMRLVKAEFLAYLVNYLEIKYREMSYALNQLTYDEIIQKVADALISSDTLRDKIFNSFPVAFIDEFQDTDTLQWQIFSQIYHLDTHMRGNVVVVGDPKQAIYRFRGADVETYLEARAQIKNYLQLDSNYRSHPEIMNFINQLFDLSNQQSSVETSFLGSGITHNNVNACAKVEIKLPSAKELQQLAVKRGVTQEFYDASVQLVVIKGSTKPERQNRLLATIAFEILALLNADPSLTGKIAILVTKNKEAAEIVKFLRRYGIRAAELKLGNIYATETANNLYLILKSMVDLANRRNFIQALSCKLLNIQLDQLDPGASNYNQLIEKYLQRFFNYKQIWDRQGVISLIYSLINDIVNDDFKKTTLTNRELANIWQLAELINEQSRKMANQSELLFWLKNKIKNANNNLAADIDGKNEELVRLDNDNEQIVITTQHKSKGLEFEILFCPYFKNSNQLDGNYDFNYRRPFFSNFRSGNAPKAALVMDPLLGKSIVENDNKEAHRLNYVALTRAKSRLYIYLKQNTFNKATGKYNQNERPDKLIELFGYVKDDPSDTSHPLFNYPQFFSAEPSLAIKNPSKLPGVVAYSRDYLSLTDLAKFNLANFANEEVKASNFACVDELFACKPAYLRQSYTALTSQTAKNDPFSLGNYFESNEPMPVKEYTYRFNILNDKNLKGATFGILFHELCEKYPLSSEELSNILQKHNIDCVKTNYLNELQLMLEESFNYKLINNLSLNYILPNSQHELEFNLLINSNVEIGHEIANLISNHFGKEHPFSMAAKSLGRIESGFLVGFIDLFFAYDGKYWVLDYKTNTLDDYSAVLDCHSRHINSLLESMADHHYYLQYLLYLVAVKRYLERRLGIQDASGLIGGTIYFYVRGIYIDHLEENQGVYLDDSCQQLVADIDKLLKSVS